MNSNNSTVFRAAVNKLPCTLILQAIRLELFGLLSTFLWNISSLITFSLNKTEGAT